MGWEKANAEDPHPAENSVMAKAMAEGRGGEQPEAGDAGGECGGNYGGSSAPIHSLEEGTCPPRLLEFVCLMM